MKQNEYQVTIKYRVYEIDDGELSPLTEWYYGNEQPVFHYDFDSVKDAEQAIFHKAGLSGEFAIIPIVRKSINRY